MKNLVVIVLLVVVAIAGYRIFNSQLQENTANEYTSSADQTGNSQAVSVQGSQHEKPVQSQKNENLVTPADMPEQAQDSMMKKIVAYQKCMLQRRPEYMQQNAKMTAMVDKTIQLCEPHLDELAAILKQNHVNEGLSKKMVHSMRSKAARKLMSNVMKTMAAQSAVTSGVAPGTATVSDEAATAGQH